MAKGGSGGSGGGGDEILSLVALFFVLLFVFGFWLIKFYGNYKYGINQVFVWISQAELLLFVPFSNTARLVFHKLMITDPATFTAAQIWAALSVGGSYFRWIFVPLVLTLAFFRWRKTAWIEKYRRHFDMKNLLEHNAEFFPALLPIVRRNRSLLDEPTAEGPWRVAESPMRFALEHEIITDPGGRPVPVAWAYQKNGLPRTIPQVPEGGYYFQAAVAESVFLERMGPTAPMGIKGFQALPRYQRGLAGAFCAYALGFRKEGKKILDAMSASFSEASAVQSQNEREIPGDFPINILNADAWVIRALKPRPADSSSTEDNLANRVQSKVALHDAFLYTWLAALLEAAREKGGTLPTQHFIWLRPAHRELWYFLNSLGGNSCHTEGAGPWSHYESERVLGRSIPTPVVKYSVLALKAAIEAEGWFQIQPGQSWTSAKIK